MHTRGMHTTDIEGQQIDRMLQTMTEGIGMRLREMRERAGITQLEASGLVGVSKANVGHWEHGRTHINAAILARLIEAYGADASYVLTGRVMPSLLLRDPARRLLQIHSQLDERDQQQLADIASHMLHARTHGAGQAGADESSPINAGQTPRRAALG